MESEGESLLSDFLNLGRYCIAVRKLAQQKKCNRGSVVCTFANDMKGLLHCFSLI